MQIIESCYICTTPFQIITATVMACEKKEVADVYIVPQFIGADNYCNRLKKLNVFRKVVLVDSDQFEKYKRFKNGFFRAAGIVVNYIRINKVVRSILLKDTLYDNIYISSKANIGRLICLYHLKHRPKTIISYFDDGEGSYNNERLYTPKTGDYIIRRVIFGKRSIDLSKTIYLYSPELFKTIHTQSGMIIKKIKTWHNDSEMLSKINTLCDYDEKKGIEEDVIFLDTLAEDVFNKDYVSKYYRIQDQINDLFRGNIVYKKHPRDNKKSDPDKRIYCYDSIPFEVICANCDMSKKIIITTSSTAVATPKILFDAEPVIVMMFNFVHWKNKDTGDKEKYYSALMRVYNDKNKFYSPHNKKEFFKCLTELKNRIINYTEDTNEQ
ncbi:hypothetical protein [Ruminococcus sp.]|uniref:hypothetical protein n=1 Tax=Ruminococcus sp. TaxID=41978 RepID=UPI0025D89747|nr:hypothetical protein [Ruminococcus sp.]